MMFQTPRRIVRILTGIAVVSLALPSVGIAQMLPICDSGGGLNHEYTAECVVGAASVILDGTGSSDPDDPTGSLLTYQWDTACPNSVIFDDSTSVTPMMTIQNAVGCPSCTVSLTVTDADGSTTCTATVTVVDTTLPVLVIPTDVTIECDADSMPGGTGEATATDNCDPTPVVAFSDVETPGACPQAKTITRTWTATDGCGNSASQVQIITVVDTTAPVLTLPPNITIECDQDSSPNGAPGHATATDNCDPMPSVTISDVDTPGSCPQEKTITRTWTATDACNNSVSLDQIITVVDTTAPVLSVPANVTIECDADSTPMGTGQATATDNCDPDPIITFSDVETPGSCPQEKTITRTWTATDACNNSVSLDQIITVVDTTAPVLSVPANVTIECDQDSSPNGAPGQATATDNCDPAPIVTHSDNVASGLCPQSWTITRTWTATDACGNSASMDQIITVVDTTAPALMPPPDVTIECDADSSPGGTGGATATDNCDPAPVVTHGDITVSGSCPQSWTITRTWTATDACGNSTSQDQVITVVDTTAPVLTLPPDITIECDADSSPGGTGDATATDNCDPAPVITFNDAISSGTCPQSWTITRTWTATDACGNNTSGDQIITVVDTTAPVPTPPPDVTIECDSDSTPIGAGQATATDNCDPDPIITFSDVETPGSCPQEKTITRTWTATDACGNSASGNQIISVVDTTPPVVTRAPDPAAAECLADVPVATNCAEFEAIGGMVSDNCAPCADLQFTHTDGPLNGQCPASLDRTYTICDPCGNCTSVVQRITLNDVTAPQMTCPLARTVECLSEAPPATTAADFIAIGGSVEDNCTPMNALGIRYEDVSDGVCPKTITRVYFATDMCGNEGKCFQTITLLDQTPPQITCPQDLPWPPGQPNVECIEDAPPAQNIDELIQQGGSVVDNCTGDLQLVSTDVPIGGTGCSGDPLIIERTYNVTDACGNNAICKQTITVEDTMPPELTCPLDVTIECDACEGNFDPPCTGQPTATDNCEPPPVVTFSDVETPGSCPQAKTITRTWTATDACGNSSICVQIITVVDTTAPVLTIPPDKTIECDRPVDPFNNPDLGLATATDNCDPMPVVSHSDTPVPNGCPQAFGIIRTWTATDACGNGVSMDQTITVIDTTPPELTVPPDVTIECDQDSSPNGPAGQATAADNCDPTPVVTFSDVETAAGTCPQEKTITRTWTATDACGNSVSMDQIITVVDTTPPVLSLPPDVTFECDACDGNFDPACAGEATATDNCDPMPLVEFNDTSVPGACPHEFLIIRAWKATDACGNMSTEQNQIIRVVDTTPPTIVACMAPPLNFDFIGSTRPDGITADELEEVIKNGTASSNPTLTAIDNCADDPRFLIVDAIGNELPGDTLFALGPHDDVPIVAEDDCGNRSAPPCPMTIIVVPALPGLSCWDLNGNGLGDLPAEDTNGDNIVNVFDCRGQMCWDLNFNGVGDVTTDPATNEDINHDGIVNVADCQGRSCWDRNGNGIADMPAEDTNGDGTVNIADCVGRNCWDLNANGVPDLAAEDTNGDGTVDIEDCRGRSCWDTNGNGIADMPAEDTNRDGVVNVADCVGLNCWDTNLNGVGDIPAEDTNGDGVVNVFDCLGFNCWDTNANGIADPSEDTNGDGSVNTLDCRGQSGPGGFSCWDLNQNGVADLDEDANGDGSVNTLDCRGQDGLSGVNCWDTNGNGVPDLPGEDTNGDGVINTLDCQGPAGQPGMDGITCWDLNGNGLADPDEDKNGDGFVNTLDCQGPTGQPGMDGITCWDLNGNGVNDPEEDLNSDGSFNTLDCGGAVGPQGAPGQNGLNCWDLNANGVRDLPDEDTNGDGLVSMLDCQGQPGMEGIHCWDLNGDRVDDPSEDINGDGFFTPDDCAGMDGLDCWDLNGNRLPDITQDPNTTEDLNADSVVDVRDCRIGPIAPDPILNATPVEGGQVMVAPPAFRRVGDVAVFQAMPEPGWQFDHWEEDATGNMNPIARVLTEQPVHLTAVFAAPPVVNFAIPCGVTSPVGLMPLLVIGLIGMKRRLRRRTRRGARR